MVSLTGFSDPKAQALLTIAASLLQSSGPHPYGQQPSVGQGIGQAGIAGLNAYNQAHAFGLRNRLSELQLANLERQEASRSKLAALLEPQDVGTGQGPYGRGPVSEPAHALGSPEVVAELMNYSPNLAVSTLARANRPFNTHSFRADGNWVTVDQYGRQLATSPIEGGLTDSQKAHNSEIQAARDALKDLTPEEISSRQQKAFENGLTNPNYDPGIGNAVRLARDRMTGEDPQFEEWYQKLSNIAPSEATAEDPVPELEPGDRRGFMGRTFGLGEPNYGRIPLRKPPAPARARQQPSQAQQAPAFDPQGALSRVRRNNPGATRSNPVMLPDAVDKLVTGRWYSTARGPAMWDGSRFVMTPQ